MTKVKVAAEKREREHKSNGLKDSPQEGDGVGDGAVSERENDGARA